MMTMTVHHETCFLKIYYVYILIYFFFLVFNLSIWKRLGWNMHLNKLVLMQMQPLYSFDVIKNVWVKDCTISLALFFVNEGSKGLCLAGKTSEHPLRRLGAFTWMLWCFRQLSEFALFCSVICTHSQSCLNSACMISFIHSWITTKIFRCWNYKLLSSSFLKIIHCWFFNKTFA